jgi:hypothetical protein
MNACDIVSTVNREINCDKLPEITDNNKTTGTKIQNYLLKF